MIRALDHLQQRQDWRNARLFRDAALIRAWCAEDRAADNPWVHEAPNTPQGKDDL